MLTGTTAVSGATTVTVGAGGTGGVSNGIGTNGSNSVFSTITAIGGGAGGKRDTGAAGSANGSNGGSGGGIGIGNTAGAVVGTATAGQGNNGGTASLAAQYGAGGGGGAGAIGGNGSTSVGGNGGAGTASSVTGSSVTYAGGGGGAGYMPGGSTAGSGGAGGGGAGGNPATSGTANTGGGGGGGNAENVAGGAGGSGVVIVRFATQVGSTQANSALLRVTDTGTVASSTLAYFEGTSGTGCIIAGNTGLSCSSDITLKKNINALGDSLGNVLALKAVTFDWNNEASGTGNHVGFIAQDVEKIFPGLVVTDPNGKLALSYDKFAPIIVKAMQEQFGGMMGVTIASVSDYNDLFSSTTTLDALATNTEANFVSDPIAYIRERVDGGIKIVRMLVSERIVAVEGYFKRIFANELCLTDSSGTPVCVTGDNLKQIGGSTQATQATSAPTPTASEPTVSPTEASSTPPATLPTDTAQSTTTSGSTTLPEAPPASESTPTASSSNSVDPSNTTAPTVLPPAPVV